jgi:hypothetical protein
MIFCSYKITNQFTHRNHQGNRVKPALKRKAIVPVFFSPVFTGFRFTKGCDLVKQSTKNMIAWDYNKGIIKNKSL